MLETRVAKLETQIADINVDRDVGENDPTPPLGEAGFYTLAQVTAALEAQGLDAKFGRENARCAQLPGAIGQPLLVNNQMGVYVFIFSGPDGPSAVSAAQQAFSGIDENSLSQSRFSGELVRDGAEKHAFQGSNIIAVVVGGSGNDRDKVQNAIEGLG